MIGRPDNSEAAEFFFNYISQVDGDDIISILTKQLDQASSQFGSVSEEISLTRYAPDKWTWRETLSHVVDTERILTFRALWFARGLAGQLPGFDQEVAVRGAEAGRISWAEHLDEFGRVRQSTISLFQHMPDNAWMRTGIASEKPFTVRAIAFVVAGHVAHHLRILGERTGSVQA